MIKFNHIIVYVRGVPHCHIVAFLHPDDKLRMNVDKIDQMIWAEIPIDFDSKEFKDYMKEYRDADKDRPQRFREFHLDPQNDDDHANDQDLKRNNNMDIDHEKDEDPKRVNPQGAPKIRRQTLSKSGESMSELLEFFDIDNGEEPSMSNWNEVSLIFISI